MASFLLAWRVIIPELAKSKCWSNLLVIACIKYIRPKDVGEMALYGPS